MNTDLHLFSNNTPDIEHVASLVESWRQSKKYASDPIPLKVKSLVFQLISSQNYNPSTLSKTLSLTYSQLKSIKSQFTNDKLERQKDDTNAESVKSNNETNTNKAQDPAMLPFKIVPHNAVDSTNNPNLLGINSCNTKPTHDAINITTSNNAHLTLPVTLPSELIFNIIKLFLCSK